MARWAPDARLRLQQAALELFAEQGYDTTTVADIAARGGLTERTFFRYFADKREVLFSGATALQEFLVAEVDAAAPGEPLDVIAAALDAAAGKFFTGRLEEARQRQAIIAAHPELRGRELIKLATLASALAAALRRRGIGDPAASLAAETGIAVFRIAFEAWTEATDGRPLDDDLHVSMAELRRVTGGRRPGRRLRR